MYKLQKWLIQIQNLSDHVSEDCTEVVEVTLVLKHFSIDYFGLYLQ